MMKEEIINLDLNLFYEKLENGLEVYIVPKDNVDNFYVTLSTKFGSKHQEFIPINERKMFKAPYGVAHFLEHKLFEQADGRHPFSFYANIGASANANTSHHKTTYLFSNNSFLKEGIEYLLDFVQAPYFTDENVLKEKGIIEQEIKMYKDKPIFTLYETSLYNSLVKHPIKIPIIGTIEDVLKTTKEDLLTCYNTFYHPSNMFLVITGNLDPNEIMKVVKDNQELKEFPRNYLDIKIKDIKEPDYVFKKEEVIFYNIAIPKITKTYKIKIKDVLGFSRKEIIDYILLYFEMKLGETSAFNDKLKKEQIINSDLNYMLVEADDHILIMVLAETTSPEKLIKLLNLEMNKKNTNESVFERKKKTIISTYLHMSDDIFSINNWIMNLIIHNGEIIFDEYNKIKELKYKHLLKIIGQISFDNYNYVIMNPKS